MFSRLILLIFAIQGSSYAIDHWIQSERVTDYGVWGAVERCWPGSFVQSFMLKTEPNQGIFEDDTANNAIQVNCVNPLTGVATGSIRSLQGDWGTWGSHYTCLPAFASGFTLRSESSQGSGDDTAANNLRMHCTDGKTLEGDGLSFGSWRSQINCMYSRHAICGLQTQVEPNQGSGDDTALNNVDFLCCELPNPAKNCEPVKESSWRIVQQCKSSGPLAKECNLDVGVGLRYDVAQLEVANAWEGAGFSLHDAVDDLPAALTLSIKSTFNKSGSGSMNRTMTQVHRAFTVQPGTMSTFSQEVRTCGHYVVQLPRLRREDVTNSGVKTVTMLNV